MRVPSRTQNTLPVPWVTPRVTHQHCQVVRPAQPSSHAPVCPLASERSLLSPLVLSGRTARLAAPPLSSFDSQPHLESTVVDFLLPALTAFVFSKGQGVGVMGIKFLQTPRQTRGGGGRRSLCGEGTPCPPAARAPLHSGGTPCPPAVSGTSAGRGPRVLQQLGHLFTVGGPHVLRQCRAPLQEGDPTSSHSVRHLCAVGGPRVLR